MNCQVFASAVPPAYSSELMAFFVARACPRELGSLVTARNPRASSLPTASQRCGSVVLGAAIERCVLLEKAPSYRSARDRCSLASPGIPNLLAREERRAFEGQRSNRRSVVPRKNTCSRRYQAISEGLSNPDRVSHSLVMVQNPMPALVR